MTLKCTICDTVLSRRDPGLQCVGDCALSFHARCANISLTNLKAFMQPGATWKCIQCRKSSRNSFVLPEEHLSNSADNHASTSNLQTNTVSTFNFKEILDLFKKTQSDINEIKSNNAEIVQSMQFFSSKIDEFESKLNQMKNLQKAVNTLQQENIILKDTINHMKDKVNEIEQHSRITNIEVQGIPETKNENIADIISKISTAIGCESAVTSIETCHRVPRFLTPQVVNNARPNQPKSIIVQFCSKTKKDEFLSFKKRKGKLTAQELGFPGDSRNTLSNIYINDHLTQHYKVLHKKVRDKARELKYQFVWVKDSKIFARKTNESIIIRIRSDNDLLKIV